MRKSLLITLEFPPQRGGTQSYYFNICKNLPSEKIVVLAPMDEEEILFPRRSSLTGDCGGAPKSRPAPHRVSDDLDPVNFKIYRKNLLVKYLYPHWLPMVWHLCRIIKREKIELVQAGQVLPCGAAVFLIGKFFNIPYAVYTHGLDILGPQKNFRKKKLMIKILRNAEKVISNSEFTKNEVAKLGIERDRIFVVYPSVSLRRSPLTGDCGGAFNLVDKQNPPPTPSAGGGLNPPSPPLRKGGILKSHQPPFAKGGNIEELRKKYNLGEKKILLSVCRLVERKGVDLVISALVNFSEELRDVVYIVVGDGPKMEDLKRLSASEGWQLPIIFTGRISDEELDLWYRMCDVFILTPKKSEFDVEGFGIVYAEASSYSKPVIGSRLAGICEAVQDGVTGVLVEPDNIEEIGQAIVELFNDEELRERLGRQGGERARMEFCVEEQMGRLREAMG
ncbi:MAG: glycosyltransferase family 4 protein [bacterium]